MSRSWLKKIGQFAGPGGKCRPRKSPRRRLNLELLEDRTLLSVDPIGLPKWVEQGPGPIHAGGAEVGDPTTRDDNITSGAIQAIAVDPSDSKIVYIGSVNGGIWRTSDVTADNPVWSPQNDHLPSLSISALAISGNTIYAGTGNFSSIGESGPEGLLLKVSKAGTDWSVLDPKKAFAGDKIASIGIATNSKNQQTILVATSDGVFHSEDGGSSFVRVPSDAGTGLPMQNVSDIVIDSLAHVFVAVPGVGVFQGNADAQQWSLLPDPNGILQHTKDIKLALHRSQDYTVLYAAPVDSRPGETTDNKIFYVLRWTILDANGATTLKTLPTPTLGLDKNGNNIPLDGGSQHFAITADLKDESVVYIAGWNAIFRGDLLTSSWDRLDDGDNNGPAFHANHTVPHTDSRAMVFVTDSGSSQDSILEANDGGLFRLLNPTGNPNASPFNAPDARRWVSANGNLRISEIVSVAYDPLNQVIFAGLQDNGSVQQIDKAQPSSWQEFEGGDGFFEGVGQPDATHVFRYSIQNNFNYFNRHEYDQAGHELNPNDQIPDATVSDIGGGTFRLTKTGRYFLSENIEVGDYIYYSSHEPGKAAGSLFADGTVQTVGSNSLVVRMGDPAKAPSNDDAENDFFIELSKVNLAKAAGAGQLSGLTAQDQNLPVGIIPFAINAVDPTRLLIGYQGLYEFAQQGDVLQRRIQRGNGLSPITALAYGGIEAGIGNPDIVYAARGNEIFVFAKTLAGDSIVQRTTVVSVDISHIVLDPDDWRIAYAVAANGIYRTTNGGASWKSIKGSLIGKTSDLRSIELVKTGTHKVLLVGGLGAVYETLDPEKVAPQPGEVPSWAEIGYGLPTVLIKDLHYIPKDATDPTKGDLLVVGTLGRGAWTLANASQYLGRGGKLSIAGDESPGMPDDRFLLVRDPVNPTLLDVFVNGVSRLAVPLLSVDSIDVEGGAGNDTLIIDSTQGAISVPGGIHYDGDNNSAQDAGDSLYLTGTNGFKELSNPPGQSDLMSPDDEIQTITFTNTENFIPGLTVDTMAVLKGGIAKLSSSSERLNGEEALGRAFPGLEHSVPAILSGVELGQPAPVEDPVDFPEPSGSAATSGSPVIQRLIESGLGAFHISDIGSSIATPEDLRARLDGLDDVDGNVTLTQTDTLTRYDVHIKKTLTGSADLKVQALGGAVDLEGTLEVSANVSLHVVFGVDADGFFIDAASNSDPELVINNLRISGEAKGAGRLGFLEVTLSNATLEVDPGVTLSVKLHEPGPDPFSNQQDGLIRVYELDSDLTDLVSVTLAGNPSADDVILTGTFGVAALVPGLDAPFDLGDAKVALTWPDVTNLADVHLSAATSAGADLLHFLDVTASQWASGITELAGEIQAFSGVDVLGTKIPLLNKTLGDVLTSAPKDLSFGGESVNSVSDVFQDGSFRKFTVSLPNTNLFKQGIAAGDTVTYQGAGGQQFQGIVDSVDASQFIIRFPANQTQDPDTAHPSFQLSHGGSLADQVKSLLQRHRQ